MSEQNIPIDLVCESTVPPTSIQCQQIHLGRRVNTPALCLVHAMLV